MTPGACLGGTNCLPMTTSGWWRRAVLALVLVPRAVTFMVGCGPPDGAAGGKCRYDGCNAYCDSGLACDLSTNTCGGGQAPASDSDASYGPVGSQCTEHLIDDACASGYGFSCTGSASLGSACDPGPVDDSGLAEYCCAPTCTRWAPWASCPAPSVSYLCTGRLTPEDFDSSISCPDASPGANGYCCPPQDGGAEGADAGVE